VIGEERKEDGAGWIERGCGCDGLRSGKPRFLVWI
jgi:hypothetical protein